MTSIILQAALARGGVDVVAAFDDGAVAARSIDPDKIDLLISDICLPGMNGLDLVRELKRRRPALRTMLLTSTPTVEHTLAAYETRVDDLLAKPCSPTDLVARVLALRAPQVVIAPRRVLAIGAHPDDVELGAGGSLARHRLIGDEVSILTLTAGACGGDPSERLREAREAAWRLGASSLHSGGLEDTRVPSSGPTVAVISEIIRSFRPSVVYTHSINDLHQDHRATHQATLIAARGVEEILCYQSPSCTVDFRPSRFVDISQTLEIKLTALAAFTSQHERSYLCQSAVLAAATYWGRFASFGQVEPLEVLRQAV